MSYLLSQIESKINMNINDFINHNPEPGWLGRLLVGDLIYIVDDDKIYQIIFLFENNDGWIDFRISKEGWYNNYEGWSLNKDGRYQDKTYALPVKMNELFLISKKNI